MAGTALPHSQEDAELGCGGSLPDTLTGATSAIPSSMAGTVVLLANSHDSLAASELAPGAFGAPAHHVQLPKGLLPAVPCAGCESPRPCLLDVWLDVVKSDGPTYVVTNGASYMHYERWATATGLPPSNLINDGTTTRAARLGALGDFDLVLRSKNIKSDVMVVAGDTLFSEGFDLHSVEFGHYDSRN